MQRGTGPHAGGATPAIGGTAVGRIGLGCYPFSGAYRNGVRDDAGAVRVIHRAIELGVTLLDTSDFYGPWHNEELVGRSVRGDRRRQVIIATKCGLVPTGTDARAARNDGRPVHIRNACDASLRRLGTDCIDLYQLHRADPQVPIAESIGAMSELVREGKVRNIGVCELGVPELEVAHAVHPLSTVQSELSLWTRDVKAEVLPWCAANQVTFLAYSPLGRGFLTGAPLPDSFPPSDPRSTMPRFAAATRVDNRALLRTVDEVGSQLGATPAQVALAWVLAQGDHVVALPGSDRISYLEENLGAAGVQLQAEHLSALDAMPAASGSRY